MGEDGWWYCLTHGTVENTRRCRGADRMGPYPDRATAERALEIAREKTRAADESERKWRDGEDD